HKDERGGRHGKRLLTRAIDEARRRGGRKVYVDTSTYRFYAGARRRYEELGFKVEARLKDYYEKGEHQIIYGLRLK
ncbi:MAG: GNAT family N-acetyltransferase, partial [Polyangiaceae bacterium]